jgi:putative PIN family toxin of toxin-antitoxin system
MYPTPKIPRVVLDTNVLVAVALAMKNNRLESTAFRVFEMILEDNGPELYASDATLYELAQTLQEPRFGLSGAFIIDFMALVADAATVVPIRGLSYPCRDADDSKFIETAVNGRCNFLVTHDKDLHDPLASRDLRKRRCAVVTACQFLTRMLRRKPQKT